MQTINFKFNGNGWGYIWLFFWTTFLTIVTFGLFFPWTASASMRWFARNTTLNGEKLSFKGTGMGFLGNWLLILVLSIITFGLYAPWGICRIYRWAVNNTMLAKNVPAEVSTVELEAACLRHVG